MTKDKPEGEQTKAPSRASSCAERGSPPATFSFAAPAAPELGGRARRDLTRFARENGASAALCADLASAVTEAVNNAVIHAGGRIRVVADVLDGALEVLVSDGGCGFGAAPASDGYGLGLLLIARSADAFSIDAGRGGAGTDVFMRFLLP